MRPNALKILGIALLLSIPVYYVLTSLKGEPAAWLIFAPAVVVLCVGFLWLGDDNSPRSDDGDKSSHSIVTWVVGFVLILLVLLVANLRLGGFCFAQRRMLVDSEVLHAAVAHQARDIEGLSSQPSIDKVKAFLSQNANCCAVIGYDAGLGNTASDRLFGSAVNWVRILHERKKRSAVDESYPYYEAYVGVGACGSIIKRIGMPLTRTGMQSAMGRRQSRVP